MALCGTPRRAASLDAYLSEYSWKETDVLLVKNFLRLPDRSQTSYVSPGVSMLAVEGWNFAWEDKYRDSTGLSELNHQASLGRNTEREMSISDSCPDPYNELATELVSKFRASNIPPGIIRTSRKLSSPLIITTSGNAVAMRIALPKRNDAPAGISAQPVALLLPTVSSLAAWFRAFLADVHESDPTRVPETPPRLSKQVDLHTPEEHNLANRIMDIDSSIAALIAERDEIETLLAAETQRADQGIRSALWEDGEALTSAVNEILSGIGFNVRDMDADLKVGKPKREDLRLTHNGVPNWEAIVEVKGYVNGPRTSDTRQIREYRDRYSSEEGHPPQLTLWVANPHRNLDPAIRPKPDSNVREAAEIAGAVYVDLHQLLRQHLLVARGELGSETVVDSLVNAQLGLWAPPIPPDTA